MLAIAEYTCIMCQRLKRLLQPQRPFGNPEQWDCFAQSLSRANFIVWLANETAQDLLREHPRSIGTVIVAIDNNVIDDYQRDAECFLRSQYSIFDYSWRRRIAIFRRLVQHRLRMAIRAK